MHEEHLREPGLVVIDVTAADEETATQAAAMVSAAGDDPPRSERHHRPAPYGEMGTNSGPVQHQGGCPPPTAPSAGSAVAQEGAGPERRLRTGCVLSVRQPAAGTG
ncbi:DUF6207 family protein [Streptomyces sp. NPDC048248]|uniref:DUF6207 family protein n=1 Tax=Streptomyces sp. NPDC048248 TaxID=3365523 RepID=UPI00371EFAF8